jgi:hypothetical protein
MRAAAVIVEAATGDAAVKVAIKEFGISDSERQHRLAARRIES